MPRDAEPPRRPRPPEPEGFGLEPEPEPTTWRPAPQARPRPNPKADPGAGRPRADREPLPVAGGPTWAERVFFGSVGSGQLAVFCRQFGSYLEAGVDLKKTLASLQDQFARTALGPVLGRLGQAIRRGDALSEAMAREPSAFDSLFLAMIRAAEARGGVPEVLRRLADHYEARRRLLRQAKAALIYPVAVLVVAGGVVLLLVYGILPMLIGILEDMTKGKGGVDLPLPTRLLIGMTHFARAVGWWAAPLAAVGAAVGLRMAYKTPGGKAAVDEACLYVPVLGKLLRKLETARFSRTLASLLDGGVDLGTSLALTADVLRLAPYRRALEGSRAMVAQGGELADALRTSGRFGPDVIATVEAGEETGRLPESLDHLADDYEEQVTYMVKNLGSLIQPFLTVALGGFVLFIALAFIMAYVSLISGLAG